MTNKQKLNKGSKSGLKSIFMGLAAMTLAMTGIMALPVSVNAQVTTIPANPPADAYNKAWFVKTINPGETVTDTVLVQNLSPKDAEIEVVARDAVQDGGGGFSLKDRNKTSTTIGSWVKLKETKVSIPANKAKPVEFTITVPSDAKPGEYAGGIVAFLADTGPAQGNIKTVNVSGSRVYITVPGALESKVENTGFDFVKPGSPEYQNMVEKGNPENINKFTFSAGFKNVSQLFVTLQSNIVIENQQGEKMEPIYTQSEGMFPGLQIGMGVSSKKEATPGKYKATLSYKGIPQISTNKQDITVAPEQQIVKEFELTQADIDKMKADYESAKAKRGGNKQNTTTQTVSSSSQPEQKAEAIVDNTSSSSSSQAEQAQPKNDNTIVIVASIIGAVLIVMLGIVIFLVSKKGKTQDKKENSAPKSTDGSNSNPS